jgi:hypothetical protein
MPDLGPDLSALLDSAASPDAAMRGILASPALIAEARAVLPALRHVATAKAGVDGVRKVIARRFATYPQPQRNEEEWAYWWADYIDTLADLSLASLEAGMRQYVADPSSEFMPKPGRLRELAFNAPCRSLLRYQRASRALQAADEAANAKPAASPEMAAAIREMAAGTYAKLSSAKAPTRNLPSIAGKPDEGGITPQMRELLARQRGETA